MFRRTWGRRHRASGSDVAPDRLTIELRSDRTYEVLVPPGERDPVVNELRHGRQINLHVLEFIEGFSAPDGRVVDFGAHVGSVALGVAAIGRHVLAVDAAETFVDLMTESARINNFDRFAAVCAAVGDHDGLTHFTVDGPFGQVSSDDSGVTVPLRTGRRLLAEHEWDRVDVVKVDVEGSEPEVFRGLSRLLESDAGPAIIFESNGPALGRRSVGVEELRQQLVDMGYTVYSVESDGYAPIPAAQPQIEGVVDLVALKPAHQQRIAHLVREPLTDDELASRAIDWSTRGAVDERLRLVEVLADPRLSFGEDSRVLQALGRLAVDPDVGVRTAAARALAARQQQKDD